MGDMHLFKEMFCSMCEHSTCDSCFVPEFSRFLAKKDEREACILCENLTDYRLADPVGLRNYYVEGAGQMCSHCYAKIT